MRQVSTPKAFLHFQALSPIRRFCLLRTVTGECKSPESRRLCSADQEIFLLFGETLKMSYKYRRGHQNIRTGPGWPCPSPPSSSETRSPSHRGVGPSLQIPRVSSIGFPQSLSDPPSSPFPPPLTLSPHIPPLSSPLSGECLQHRPTSGARATDTPVLDEKRSGRSRCQARSVFGEVRTLGSERSLLAFGLFLVVPRWQPSSKHGNPT